MIEGGPSLDANLGILGHGRFRSGPPSETEKPLRSRWVFFPANGIMLLRAQPQPL